MRKKTDAIVPVDVPMAAYSNMDCQALAQEYLKEQATLSAVSKQQNGAATGDAFGVFLIGVPMSSTFGGDKKGQLSITNGKVKAIEANLRGEECNVPTVGKPVAKKPR